MTKYEWYWLSNRDWYFRRDDGVAVIRDDAPEEAKKSYRIFLDQLEAKRIREESYRTTEDDSV